MADQIYRIEIRWDFTGTEEEARKEAHRKAGQLGAEVTGLWDEAWNELDV